MKIADLREPKAGSDDSARELKMETEAPHFLYLMAITMA